MPRRFTKGLFKTLWILRDYLPEIVVGGGWAPFLYYRYLVKDTDRDLIFTRAIGKAEGAGHRVADNRPIAGERGIQGGI